MGFNWAGKNVLITGGASCIASHLADSLISRNVHIRAVDNLSSGSLENIKNHLNTKSFEFIEGDLKDGTICRKAMQDMDIVFHLAADHGGRAYVDRCQAGPASNMLLDGMVFREAANAKIKKVVFASSGCVYPNHIQTDVSEKLYLKEEMVGPPYNADNMYGWAKLMGELTLKSYCKEYGLKAATCRYFIVYGPRAKEDLSIMAMIAKAFTRQDPFEVWGDGEQLRNWTYVQDIVDGTILAAEKIDDGTAVNIGTMERLRVIDAVQMIIEAFDYKPEILKQLDMPVGPVNRIADNSLAEKLIDWKPKFTLREGLKPTIEWYRANKNVDEVKAILAGGGLLNSHTSVVANSTNVSIPFR
jgi:nucleoside-diphosphate-sugar epimerase